MRRLTLYNWGINFDYWRNSYDFVMQGTNDNWRCKSESFVRIGLEAKWFATDSFYYDGNTIKSVTILGIQFGKGYTYDSRPIAKWGAA